MDKKDTNDNNFELTDPEILAFEREKQDSNILKNYRNKKKNSINKRLIFFRIFFIIIFIGSAGYLVKWQFDNKENEALQKNLSQYIAVDSTSSEAEFSVDFVNLTSINKTCFAWLVVNGTDVSYPVVHYTNNDYYLTHSFDYSYNPAGWIFADYKNTCDGYDKNLVIYGHNRRNGSMFSSLKNILNKDWYSNENNLVVSLYTPDGLTKYQVFSVYEIKAETYYLKTSFLSDSSFLTFLNDLKNRSIHDFNVDLSGEDKILTLSTCSNNNNYRTVLHAKKMQAEI